MRRRVLPLAGADWAVAHRPGRGRPLLLLHGFTGTGLDFEPVLAAFEGRPLWAPDLPGHGRTAGTPRPPTPSFPTVRAGLRALVEVAGEAPDVFGYSMGGRLALDAVLHGALPHRRLMLLGAAPGLADPHARAERRAADALLAERLEREGTGAFLHTWGAQPMFAHLRRRLGEAAWKRLQQRRAEAPALGLASALRGLGTGEMTDATPGLAGCGAPTLCIAGAEDTKFVALGRTMAAALPHGRFASVEMAGHAAHLERPTACIPLLRGFLAD
jgi:2-succinyl-6-hydroxy-2,4-cyclohexadiene-1-carboxylate synthase